MTRFNFEAERDSKHRRNSRGKTLRVILLFCLVALITAAVIYAIIPRTAPESKTGKPENLSENAPKNPDTEKLSTRNEKTPAINGENEESKSLPDTTDHGSTPQVTDRQTGSSEKENSSTATESAGKFMPSDNELFKMTGILRKKLADGSWKSGKDVVTHRVAGGDSLEKIARKYHTTVQFLQQYNRISDPNTIRIGQKIRCFAADSWQVNISYHLPSFPVRQMPEPRQMIWWSADAFPNRFWWIIRVAVSLRMLRKIPVAKERSLSPVQRCRIPVCVFPSTAKAAAHRPWQNPSQQEVSHWITRI